jgi:hypothetical protein
MMEIKLTRPAAGQQHVVDTLHSLKGEELSLVMDVLPEDAILERTGDDAIIMFADEASIVLPDFFLDFTRENVPELIAGDRLVAGSDFWDLLQEEQNLNPQAGPGHRIPNGGRHHEYEDLDLLGGYDILGGLDTGFMFPAGPGDFSDVYGEPVPAGGQTNDPVLLAFLANPDNRALAYDGGFGRNEEPDAQNIAAPGRNGEDLLVERSVNILSYVVDEPLPAGGPGLDLLLVDSDDTDSLSALFDADPDAVRDIEIILLGDALLSLTNADSLLEQLGLSPNSDETIAVDPARWQAVEDPGFADAGYEAYADDELHILVQKTALEQGAA